MTADPLTPDPFDAQPAPGANADGGAPPHDTSAGPPGVGDLAGSAAGHRAQRASEFAGQIIGQAASILEEELAAGINAARGIEERFVDVQGVRSADPDQLMQRLRRDAHDIVDLVVDLVDVAVNSTGSFGRRAVAVRGSEGNGHATHEERGSHVPTLVVPEPVPAGEVATTALVVENNRSTVTGAFEFTCSDLVSAGGHRIGGEAVTFSPRQVSVSPQSSQRVTVLVSVPAEAAPGTYSGLLQGGGVEHVRAVLSLEVRASSLGEQSA